MKKVRFDFSVRDTGIGITSEQQKRLFKAFSQADSSTTRKFGGTGLGLIISNLLAEKMGGKIKMTSEYGKGSIFSFSIVAECGKDEARKNLPAATAQIKRILIVDDNEANRTILSHNLAYLGIECVECDNGLAALKTLETSAFDLMITDYDMPYVNGLETIKMVREKLRLTPEVVPVILLHSSADDKTIMEECKKLGVRFSLVKPVKVRELIHLLKNVHCVEKNEAAPKADLTNANSIPVEGDRDVTFLIAEDVEMNMQLVKIMVKKIVPGAKIIEARNGKQAVEMALKTNPGIVLMDVQMPEMDGVEAVKAIRNAEAAAGKNRVPIIALTAGAIKDEREKCLKAGMDDFITKPIDPALLRKILEKYIKYTDKKVEFERDNDGTETNETQLSFNRKEFMDKVGGDKAIYKELVEMSFESASKYINALEGLIKERNIYEIKKIAHSLRGLALTVCFNRLAWLTMIAEKNVETDLKAVSEVYERMKAELKSIAGALKTDENLK